MKKIIITLIALYTTLSFAETKRICEIRNVRPLTEAELAAAGIPQINYGKIYKQEMVCKTIEIEKQNKEEK
jgi:hypothetical protein